VPALASRAASGFEGDQGVPETFLAACALVLVLEGLLPLVAPRAWRNAFRRLTELSDGQLRFIGLLSVAIGVLTLFAFYA
jgi:uncharacterized protein YjeT (DUF2065 family)